LLAVVVWQVDWNWAVPSRPAASGDRPGQGESTAYRSAARERLARGWEAETADAWPERGPPANWPRAVKTVKFLAPPRDTTVALHTTAALAPSASPFPSIRAAAVKSWRYQLQNINPAEVAKSSADLVVIDYASDGAPFTKAQVEQMKTKPDGSRRIVLSYMSIGEAENYRWYWSQRSSSWLGAENRQWKGNYAVRFWDPAWQEIIFSYTDRILAAGFDGVYLDKVDEFETVGRRDDMVTFVTRIAARAKAAKPEFLVISQNGDALLAEAKFRKAIDGFAREDLFYGEDSDGVRNNAGNIRESVARLKKLAAEGKPVFVVEYPKTEAQAQTARREIAELGFVGLIARRELGAL